MSVQVCIHQMNRVNSRNGYGHDSNTINNNNTGIIIMLILYVQKQKQQSKPSKKLHTTTTSELDNICFAYPDTIA